MKILHSVEEMVKYSFACRLEGKSIGVVPTMGALHSAHISLLSIAQENSDISVMSIFVNPSQFGPGEDFTRYPRPFENDRRLAEEAGCDLLFVPSVAEMYPEGYKTSVTVSGITERLCGVSRPTHFSGVATVVLKLFNIITPQVAVFGAKDAQQVAVIRRMVNDLNCQVNILVGPIVREQDGLAKSSRNVYLTPNERRDASLIYRGIQSVAKLNEKGIRDSAELLLALRTEYEKSNLILLEYAEIVDSTTIEPVTTIKFPSLLAVACRMKESMTRLIDNTVLGG